MADIPHDERRQLSRLIKERDDWHRTDTRDRKYLYIASGILVILLFIDYYFGLPTFNKELLYIISFGILLSILPAIYFSHRWDFKEPLFVCPNTRCRGEAPALNWQCTCGKIHALEASYWLSGAAKPPKVIGEPCDACGLLPSHYICPHCHTSILLDATRPRTKAAVRPGYVRPPREPGEERAASPLAEFDDLEP